MIPLTPSHGLMCFEIPAVQVNEIVTWILRADETYMQQQIERHGFAQVIGLNGVRGFERITALPAVAGIAVPYYGTIGGAYVFSFTLHENETRLLVEHRLGDKMGLSPLEVKFENQPRFETHAEQTSRWYYNRVEFLIDKRNVDYSMCIDGEIYANMLAVGWQKEIAHEYRYQFNPTTVGCTIHIHHLPDGQSHDLTANIDW